MQSNQTMLQDSHDVS
jgi:hypothetical protein